MNNIFCYLSWTNVARPCFLLSEDPASAYSLAALAFLQKCNGFPIGGLREPLALWQDDLEQGSANFCYVRAKFESRKGPAGRMNEKVKSKNQNKNGINFQNRLFKKVWQHKYFFPATVKNSLQVQVCSCEDGTTVVQRWGTQIVFASPSIDILKELLLMKRIHIVNLVTVIPNDNQKNPQIMIFIWVVCLTLAKIEV